MSALPTRKKTPEELAKLREEQGIPSPFPGMPAAPSSSAPTAPDEPANTTATPLAAPPAIAVEPEPPRPVPVAKKVRSLKKSERKARLAPLAVVGDPSSLTAHRHSRRELEIMRLNEARRVMSQETPPAIQHLKVLTAHPVIVILGYLLALAGGLGAFPVALYIAIKKPRSRHHAGFMAVIAAFVTFFGVLHYFPNLQPIHGS